MSSHPSSMGLHSRTELDMKTIPLRDTVAGEALSMLCTWKRQKMWVAYNLPKVCLVLCYISPCSGKERFASFPIASTSSQDSHMISCS